MTVSRVFLCLALLALVAMPSFADAIAKESICPVCRVHEGERDPEPVVATSQYEGETFGLCSEACLAAFEQAPAYYLPPVFPRPAPSFVVTDVEGAEFSSEELKGRVVLLDFWATWCPPCIDDLPKLSQLHERHVDKGLTVVSVSIDEGKNAAKKVARMMKKGNATHPVYLDGGDPTAWASYLVKVVPAQFLIDAEGNIVAQWSGKSDLAEVESEVLRLLTPGSS